MKKSRYNMLIPYKENSTIIFNPLYGALGKFDDDNVKAYKEYTLTDDQIDLLYKKKILIDDDIDEVEIINKDRAEGILDSKNKLFRIWPTTGCNARCFYCFEKGIKAENMTEETANDVAKYVISRVEPGDKLQIEWFGGEPLLNIKAMDIISEKVIKYCEENNIPFRAYIITNGSLITKELADNFISKYKIDSAQITLDGYGKYYDYAKAYYSEENNFKSVIHNIRRLLDNKVTVSIRLNYSGHNYSTLDTLIDYLHDEIYDPNHYLRVYVYPLWSSTDNTAEDKYVSDVTVGKEFIYLIDKLVNYKFMKLKRVMGLRYKRHQCYARKLGTCSILPNGDISKCAENYNQIIGNIYDGIINTDLYNEWTSIELDPECMDCKYLPLCNDGCKGSKFNGMDRCMPTKDITEELVKWYVSKLDSKN